MEDVVVVEDCVILFGWYVVDDFEVVVVFGYVVWCDVVFVVEGVGVQCVGVVQECGCVGF